MNNYTEDIYKHVPFPHCCLFPSTSDAEQHEDLGDGDDSQIHKKMSVLSDICSLNGFLGLFVCLFVWLFFSRQQKQEFQFSYSGFDH